MTHKMENKPRIAGFTEVAGGDRVANTPRAPASEAGKTSAQSGCSTCHIRVLHLARSFPNSVFPRLGLWTERLVRSTLDCCAARVVAPVPYFPPLPGPPEFTQFRRVESQRETEGFAVFHPRFFVGPGYSLRRFESATYSWAISGLVEKLRQDFPFDLIHAHFTYPDGVVAARLAQRYEVPLIITEQAPWLDWMKDSRNILRKSLWAIRQSTFVVAVSTSARDSIQHYSGLLEKLRVIPNAVDDSIFTLPKGESETRPNRILFAGIMRFVKGVDVLLRALRRLADQGRILELVVVGESFYSRYRRDETLLRQMVRDLELEKQVRFLGPKPPSEVAEQMREAALLVLPSRAESFGLVLAEALACGTPVVATRCGGPEDFVNDEVGVLVPPEDPEALARGIERVLDRRTEYKPDQLRNYALEKFSMQTVGRRYTQLYWQAVQQSRGGI